MLDHTFRGGLVHEEIKVYTEVSHQTKKKVLAGLTGYQCRSGYSSDRNHRDSQFAFQEEFNSPPSPP